MNRIASTTLLCGVVLAGSILQSACRGKHDVDPEKGGVASVAPIDKNALHVAGGTPEQAGRYLILLGGCNDCHTPGFAQRGMAIPEEDWLTGDTIGFRGPWGTTYASNLRLFVKDFKEEDWVQVMHARHARPPMPWSAVNEMSDRDLAAIYRFIKSLGPTGRKAPEFVPPNQEPRTPYILMEPQEAPVIKPHTNDRTGPRATP